MAAAGGRNQEAAPGLHVKQAFLSAPLLSNGVQIVVMTPNMFRRHNICTEKYWSVHQALYGLTISPRSWSVHRDGTLAVLELEIEGLAVRIRPMTSDPNVWVVYRENRRPGTCVPRSVCR